MNLIQRAKAWFADTMKAGAGVTVLYSRSGQSPRTITAWVGRTLFSIAEPGSAGNRVEWGDRDYLIAAIDIASLGEPQRGDRITEVLAEGTVVFEVMPPSGEPAWRWSDQQRTVYRVHCKRITT